MTLSINLQESKYLTLKEASDWASLSLGKNVTTSNISYLINYGRIHKHIFDGITKVSQDELIKYYNSFNGKRELSWKEQLGNDLNWALSFDQYKEADTTKHVHRLHPYKGKFIPQLVEYFLDDHIDIFKKEAVFKPGDIVLDPFCGSGTTLVQANELGMHAIGIDVSHFNALISNCKLTQYNLNELCLHINTITKDLVHFLSESRTQEFDERLAEILYKVNKRFFPVPEYKHKIYTGLINEMEYSSQKEKDVLSSYFELIKEYGVQLKQTNQSTFLDKWYIKQVREEIEFVNSQIQNINNSAMREILGVILSRTVRSCRATTHSDLATLLEPVMAPYYCSKHGKICKPLFSILKWWKTYSQDTIKRLNQFNKLRTQTFQYCITKDSREVDIITEIGNYNPIFADLVRSQQISGIFSSPPYVGMIDYHEQHAYAYDLYDMERSDSLEIGPLIGGQGRDAKEKYLSGISQVLLNSAKFMVNDFNVFLVANDKYNLYPAIADKSNMKIVKTYKRPVLNRTEKAKGAYSEIIFHLKEK